MKSYNFLFCYLCFGLSANLAFSQKATIYHLGNNKTHIHETNNLNTNTYYIEPGKEFVINVANANPMLYDYSVIVDTALVNFEKIDVADFVSKIVESNVGASGIGESRIGAPSQKCDSSNLTFINHIIPLSKEFDQLKNKFNKLKSQIEGTDKDDLDLSQYNAKKTSVKVSGEYTVKNYSADKTGCPGIDEYFVYLYKDYLKLSEEYNNLYKKFINSKADFTFITKAEEGKEIILHLVIKAKFNSPHRDTGSSVIIIKILPKHKWRELEIVPNTSFYYGGKTTDFEIYDGILKEKKSHESYFRPGAILNFSVLKPGKRDEYNVGVGIGCNYSNDGTNFGNFSLNLTAAYLDQVRINIGVGYAQFTNGLKDGYVVNQLVPGEISNINDVKDYDFKTSFLLGVNITGFTFGK